MIIIREVRLQEELIPVNKLSWKILTQNMKEDPELKQRLTSPVLENPYYRFLVAEVAPNLRHSSLLSIIAGTQKFPEFRSFFCKVGNKITAFVAYVEDGDIITDIKIFSFMPEKQTNPAFAKDLIHFIKENQKTHSKIEWKALKENPANRAYMAVLKLFKGERIESGGVYNYIIAGNK
jgi:hypothetical protein